MDYRSCPIIHNEKTISESDGLGKSLSDTILPLIIVYYWVMQLGHTIKYDLRSQNCLQQQNTLINYVYYDERICTTDFKHTCIIGYDSCCQQCTEENSHQQAPCHHCELSCCLCTKRFYQIRQTDLWGGFGSQWWRGMKTTLYVLVINYWLAEMENFHVRRYCFWISTFLITNVTKTTLRSVSSQISFKLLFTEHLF